jgi:hypothetical protein
MRVFRAAIAEAVAVAGDAGAAGSVPSAEAVASLPSPPSSSALAVSSTLGLQAEDVDREGVDLGGGLGRCDPLRGSTRRDHFYALRAGIALKSRPIQRRRPDQVVSMPFG